MKKFFIVLTTSLLFSNAIFAQEKSSTTTTDEVGGTIHFSGRVVESTCNMMMNSVVKLNDVANLSDTINLNMNMTNCFVNSLPLQQKMHSVQLKLVELVNIHQSASNVEDALAKINNMIAKNVAVQVLNPQGEKVDTNSVSFSVQQIKANLTQTGKLKSDVLLQITYN